MRKSHLQRHALSHSDERPYSCSTCDSSFKVLSNLRKHEKIHAGKKPYACHVADCSSAFLKKTQLYSHLLAAHDISTPFKCEVCNTNFTTQSHLNRHTQNQHLSRFMCTDCYEMFDMFSALQKHISKTHKKKPHCARCSLSFSSKSNLNSHIARCHISEEGTGSSTQSSVELKTEVVYPEQVDNSSDNLISTDSTDYHNIQYSEDVDDIFEEDKTEICKDERVLQTEVKVFNCKTCNETFTSKTLLTKHMKSVHNTLNLTEYKCSECSSIFKSKSNIVKHIQSKHKGVKRFYCTLCPMKFYYKHAFERHTSAVHGNKKKVPRKAWNKTSLVEDLSGHFVDDKVKRYLDCMSQQSFKKRKVMDNLDESSSEQNIEISGS